MKINCFLVETIHVIYFSQSQLLVVKTDEDQLRVEMLSKSIGSDIVIYIYSIYYIVYADLIRSVRQCSLNRSSIPRRYEAHKCCLDSYENEDQHIRVSYVLSQ